MSHQEIRVPNLGDFQDVPIVEILVKPGDAVETETPLVTVESDKATMDIPSPLAGTIISIKVAVGDSVSEGSVIGIIETKAATSTLQVDDAEKNQKAPDSDRDGTVQSEATFDVAIIGGGPGGYSAAFRAADLGLNVALIDRRKTLGGVCLNVGCIPSKALLHLGAIKEEAERLSAHGINFSAPEVDIDAVRAFKSEVVGKLTTGLSHMASKRQVSVFHGTAKFSGERSVNIVDESGRTQTIDFNHAIVAAGSEPVKLPFLPDDDRIFDSTGALELPEIPKRMLVVGGGIIGLEMATVYSSLGAEIDVVEMADRLFLGVDSDLVATWKKRNDHRFGRIMLSTRLERIDTSSDELTAHFDNGEQPGSYDLVLIAAGRTPNGDGLNLSTVGVATEDGFILVDDQMRTNVAHIFAIGDIVGQPMLAHKAVHEGHVAAEVIAGEKSAFDPLQIPSVAYTDPEIAWAGVTEAQAKRDGRSVTVGRFPWSASGRAIASGADYGATKLIFDSDTGRLVGGAIVGPHAGDMIGEVSLAIEMGADALDIGQTIHPHPTMGESIGMAAEVAKGICTDLLPQKKR